MQFVILATLTLTLTLTQSARLRKSLSEGYHHLFAF